MTPDTPTPDPALGALAGCRAPGGCDDCNAYQTFERATGRVYVLTVHHDATCPWLAARADDR